MAGRRNLIAGLICSFAVSANACSNSDQPVNPPSAPPSTVAVQGVRVTPQLIQLNAIGETRQISATISPLNATDHTIVWESSDPTIASVDSVGRVTARAPGFGVFVTAFTHDGRYEASVNVSVVP